MTRCILGVLLSLAPVMLWYCSLRPFTTCKIALLQFVALNLLALGMGAAWCGSWPWLRAVMTRLLREPLSVAVLVGVLSACCSTVFSMSPHASLFGSSESEAGLLSILCFSVLFFSCRLGCETPQHIRRLFGFALIGLGLTCGYATAQILGFDPLSWGEASIYRNHLRPSGAAGHTNTLAGLIVMSLPLIVGLLTIESPALDSRKWVRRLALVALALVSIAVLGATLSRACWLAGIVIVVFLVLAWPQSTRSQLRLCGIATLGIMGVLVAWTCSPFGDALRIRLASFNYASTRLEIWRTIPRIFADFPLFGCGLDTFGLTFPRYRGAALWQLEWGVLPDQAHNEFLHTLATQGVCGVFAYLVLRIAVVWSVIRAWRGRPEQRRLILVLTASVLAYEVQHLCGFATCVTAALFMCSLGWIARLATPPAVKETPAAEPSACWLAVACAIGGWGILGGNFASGEAPPGEQMVILGLVALGGALALACSWDRGTFAPYARFALLRGKLAGGMCALLLAILCGPFVVGPGLGSWYAWRAESMLEAQPDHAPELLDRAVSWAPHHAAIHSSQAKCLQQIANWPGTVAKEKNLRLALAAIEEACRLEPSRAIHHANRSRILSDVARLGLATPDEVFSAFDQALALDPCDTVCLADAGRAAVSLGCPERGRPYLKRGLALDEHLGYLHAEMGGIALVQKQLDRADEHLTHSMECDWHGDQERREKARCLLALTKFQQGDAPAALRLIEKAMPLMPDTVSVRWLHASILEQLGRKSEALHQYLFVHHHLHDHAAALQAIWRLKPEWEIDAKKRPKGR